MNINITEYGAVADGKKLNTTAIQNAIDACCAAGGGRVIISGGTYLTGTILLKENVELHIAADGILLGSPRCEDYPERADVRHVASDKLPRWRNACLIYAEDCRNISITGIGTIDANGKSFVRKKEGNTACWDYERIDAPTPPRVVFFAGCQNVKISDVTMVNQPSGWSYWITDCDYVTFDRVKILAEVNYPNNDGIHINSSRNVTISNCMITTGDDCLVVRANNAALAENKVCEKVVVSNCTLTSYSGGIRIGWLNDGVIRNCTFSNLVMTDTSVGISISLPFFEPDRRFTHTADMGREATLIENLSFSNIIMDKTASLPIKVRIDENPGTRCTAIRNLYFTNIHSRGPELPMLMGRRETPLENIFFSDCSFEQTDGSEFEHLSTHGACEHYDGGFYPMQMKFAKHITFQNTRFDIHR